MIGFIAILLAAPIFSPPPTPADMVLGHCWAGRPKPTQIDRHCFRQARDGSVRDHHEVTEGGNLLMSGDAVYRWDGGKLRYTYRDSMGGTVSGVVTRDGNAVDFGTAQYRAKDGRSFAIHTRWTILGPTSYRSELSSPAVPLMKAVTVYSRAS